MTDAVWRVHRLVPALIALLGMSVISGFVWLQDPSQPAPPPAPRNTLAPVPPKASAFGWRLSAAMSAHRALVLEVESTRPAEAMAIAQRLTEPYADRFDEVLVYFFEPDTMPRRASVRVQWTRTHGYRTLVLRGQ